MAIITALIMIIIMGMKTTAAAAAASAATPWLSAIFCFKLYSAATGKQKNEGGAAKAK